MSDSTCERCRRAVTITVATVDSRGPWRLCVRCHVEITRDNAELRKHAEHVRAIRAAFGQRFGGGA